MQFLIIFAVLLVAVYVLTGPLRRAAPSARGEDAVASVVSELEAARDAKYREIRDAELDHATGKLSDEDFAAVDAGLRAEAIEILTALDSAAGPVPSTAGARH